MDIAETIREEILRAKKKGLTRYQIAKDFEDSEIKVTEVQLCRLMNGKTLTAETLGVLLDYFGYRLVKGKARRKS